MTDIQARKEGNLIVVDLPQVPTGTGGITKQREWVALTDEEIEGAIDEGFAFGLDGGNVSNKYVIRYARAIEQALKEKNNG
jgi:hypothetical protein